MPVSISLIILLLPLFLLIEIFPIFDRICEEKKREEQKQLVSYLYIVSSYFFHRFSSPSFFFYLYITNPDISLRLRLLLFFLPHTHIHLMRKTTSLLNCPPYTTSLVAYEISNRPRSLLVYVIHPIE